LGKEPSPHGARVENDGENSRENQGKKQGVVSAMNKEFLAGLEESRGVGRKTKGKRGHPPADQSGEALADRILKHSTKD